MIYRPGFEQPLRESFPLAPELDPDRPESAAWANAPVPAQRGRVRPPWYKRPWFVGPAFLLLGMGVGGAVTEAPQSTVTPLVTAPNPAKAEGPTGAPAAPATTTPARLPAPKAPTIAEDGVFLVGTDIKPGTYKAAGGDTCYWARLKNTAGELDSIIANGIGSGRQVVTIRKTDAAFETRGCGTWTQ
jgi:hypothetical protein